MIKKALEALKILEDHGHQAYIVGGYVRDHLLGIDSKDIDICTDATPKEIIELFVTSISKDVKYGSVRVIYKKASFDITTFRKEIKYEDNRKPIKIKYIKNLKKDLLRRDFTINTLCMDKNGVILDKLDIYRDLQKRIIKTVGNPKYKLKEDALRIIRAIRFATNLDFEIDLKTKYYITKYAYLLKKLSYTRKKEELNKIFLSKNREKGIKLLIELKLEKYLDLHNLADTININDITGIWSVLNVDDIYPFSNLEKEQMANIRELMNLNILDKYNIYKYGLYLTGVVADIKNIDKKELNLIYNNLPILSIKEIEYKPIDIACILNRKPGPYLKDIMLDIESNIISGNIENNKESISNYIINNYQ